MPQIGTLVTGAGVETTIAGQATCASLLYLGDIDTTQPLSGLSVEIDGVPFINIRGSATLCTAYAKWGSRAIEGTNILGVCFKIGTGKINRNTTYRLVNNGATTPVVRVLSDNQDGIPYIVSVKGINALSFEDFSKFSALIIDTPANVNNIEMNFRDGHRETWSVTDADAYYALNFEAEADGRLGGCTVIDNTAGQLSSVRINATTAISVLQVKLPDAAFAELKGA
jgi:hypothetical protein